MAVVLVTGATGALGRVLVPALRAAGHEPRAMSRRPGADVVADVLDPAALATAVAGVDRVLHLASSPRKDARRVEVDGTRNLLATGVPVTYLSIVGCDRTPFGYYRAKTEAEGLVREAGGTVVRATQFHGFARYLARAVVPRGARLQPVAESFVAEVLVDAVAGPAPAEVAGPEVLTLAEIARRCGRRAVELPVPGRLVSAVRAGSLLAGPDALVGGPALSPVR